MYVIHTNVCTLLNFIKLKNKIIKYLMHYLIPKLYECPASTVISIKNMA